MLLLHIVILALVQGITEFLPVSSSGHLVLAWEMLDRAGVDLPQQTMADRLTIDIAVHLGTLFAVCVYFRRDIGQMALGTARLATLRFDKGARLALYLVIGTIPLGLVGLIYKDEIVLHLHNVEIVAWATLGFGILLFLADRTGMTIRRIEHMTWVSALAIGLAQILALIPGTSRSGITMTMARFLGFEPAEAARFSLLLSIPAIAAPAVLIAQDLYRAGNIALGLDALVAVLLSFFAALASIAVLIGWLNRANFTIFVLYRTVLGGALLCWIYWGA